ncbi:hypothetical protein GCM10009119_19330 [Algoriphagus jejuensis]|uniref:Thioredoxin domain-containing protein n=2 Tax=Algoriphagus jejuensis TaxID=419934 RepID=A0ABP3YC68_9BACT
MLYLEIDSPNPPDTLWVTYWEHLLIDQKSVTPGISFPVVGKYGNLFEGSIQKKVYLCELPQGITDGFLSIGKGRSTLIHQWFFSSGDRVRIHFNLVSGKTLFGGPDQNFYRAQYGLDQLFAEEQFNRDPVMVSESRKSLFQDSLAERLYREAQSRPDDLFVRMKVLVTDTERWEQFGNIAKVPVDQHPAWRLLHKAQDSLTAHQISLLGGRVAGALLSSGLTWASMGSAIPENDPTQYQMLQDWVGQFGLEQLDSNYPLLIHSESRLIRLTATLQNRQFLEVWKDFDSPLKDEILGTYLLENFNTLGAELAPLLDTSLSLVESPWIRDKLETLAAVYSVPVFSGELFDESGSPVDLNDFTAKTLLIHFWISGCRFCIDDYQRVMKALSDRFEADPDILLISVNVDSRESTWKNSLESGRYTSPQILNLKAYPGRGIAGYYRIHSYPQKMIVGPDSKVRLQAANHLDSDYLSALLVKISTEASPSFSLPQTSNQ